MGGHKWGLKPPKMDYGYLYPRDITAREPPSEPEVSTTSTRRRSYAAVPTSLLFEPQGHQGVYRGTL